MRRVGQIVQVVRVMPDGGINTHGEGRLSALGGNAMGGLMQSARVFQDDLTMLSEVEEICEIIYWFTIELSPIDGGWTANDPDFVQHTEHHDLLVPLI